MFIVCPSCSGPYRIAADQISALVQVACPHCEYKVILDFEAANDPALREPGHQYAQGYEDAKAYFSVYSHVGKNPDARPFQSPGLTGAAADELKATGTTGTPPATPPAKPVEQKPQPLAEARPAEVKPAAAGTSPLSTPATGLLGAPAASMSSKGAKTVMHTPSKKPVPLDPTSEPLAPRPKAPSGPTMHAGAGTEQVNEGKPELTQPEPASDRKPPHTPPTANVVSSGPTPVEPAPVKVEDPAAQSHSQLKPSETAGEKKPVEVVKPAETTPVKPPDNAVKPVETSNAKFIVIGIILVVLIVVAILYVLNKP